MTFLLLAEVAGVHGTGNKGVQCSVVYTPTTHKEIKKAARVESSSLKLFCGQSLDSCSTIITVTPKSAS